MPSLNWFSLNRVDGGPSYFGNTNRLTASFYWNDWLFGVVITAAAFVTVLLLLSPIYKHQWRTISMVTTSILMGGAFILALVQPWWQTMGPVSIQAPIRVHDTEYRNLIIEVHVGLNFVNITLLQASVEAAPPPPRTDFVLPRLLPRDSLQRVSGIYDRSNELEKIQYNEQIDLKTAEEMQEQFRSALERGLPVPILTIINYLSHQEEGFRWSVDLRQAGYFCQFTLTLTIICWAWMNIFFLVIPQHGAIAMIITGLLALLAVFLYWILLPARDLIININGSILELKLDGCFWTVITTGFVALLTGSALLIVEIQRPGSLSFDLEIDSDLKTKIINKVVERRSLKLQPSLSLNPHKTSLKQQISVVDGTTDVIYTEQTTIEAMKSDSGISTVADTTTGVVSQNPLDSVTDLEQIATLDGSYLKSTVTNLLQVEGAPKIYSYTFRHGRELPSFHESTISLHSETVPRYLDSIIEEDIVIHRSADSPSPSALADKSRHSSESSEKEDWHDPLEGESDDVEHHHSDSDGHNDTFCSIYTSAKKPSPRRRSQRALSMGSHRDIIGNS